MNIPHISDYKDEFIYNKDFNFNKTLDNISYELIDKYINSYIKSREIKSMPGIIITLENFSKKLNSFHSKLKQREDGLLFNNELDYYKII